MFFTKSLRTKMLLLTLVPLALTLVAVGIIGSFAYEKAAKDIVADRDTEFARALASQLSGDLGQYSQVLRGIAAEDDLRSMEPHRLSLALEEAQNLLYIFDGGLVVYDSEGIALWSEPFAAERQGTAFSATSTLHEVRSTLKPAFSDVFEDEMSDEDMILIAVPIVGSDNKFKGILAGMCTLRYSLLGAAYAEVLEFQAGRSGYAYLVDGNGQVIYHRYTSIVGTSLADTVPVVRAMGGETGAVLAEDATGETIIAGFAPVSGTGWGLITQERWENIVGPIDNYNKLFLGLLIAGGVLSCGLIFFFVGRVLQPIGDLTGGAQRIAAGNFDYTITANTGDEIQTLAKQFNTMANALKEHTASLTEEITQRKQAEARLQHLALVLRAIRNVNQLITKEKDRDKLLKGSCDNLVQTRGYSNAWITLLDESGRLTAHAESGLGKSFLSMVDLMKHGQLTSCGQRALHQSEPVVTEDPASTCTDCPLSTDYAGKSAATIRLEYGGKVYGILSVSVPRETVTDVEELGLFHEVATDIAFALHNIEMEEKRKQAEKELEKHRDHLEELVDRRTKELRDTQQELLRSERLATLGQFSGSISHELRNPLGVIDSSAYYLKARLKDADQRVQEHLERIKSSVSNSTAIIESLLNLTRMKEPQLERLNLATIITDAIATSKLPATVNITQDFPQQEVLVDADREQLRMALKNMIRNAVEAMDNKGSLTLTVRTTPDKQTELSFTDNGPGIAKENLEKVFQPLFSTKAKGIGFGLSIVRMIVDKHGGTVEAKSESGKGATIIIRLPSPATEDKEG